MIRYRLELQYHPYLGPIKNHWGHLIMSLVKYKKQGYVTHASCSNYKIEGYFNFSGIDKMDD